MTTAGSVNVPGAQQAYNFAQPTIGGVQSNIGGLSNYTGLGATFLPGQALATEQNLYFNPYAGQAQAGAGTAAGLGTQAAQNQFGTGGDISAAGMSLIPGAQQIMQTGFDPQQALYARTLQQVQDQANVQNAMAGVATSPYGAGLTNQATTNFNIDWQKQQLANQVAALQAAGGAVSQAGGAAQLGAGLQAGAAPLYAQSAAMPYQTAQGIGQGQFQDMASLLGLGTQGANLSQLPIADQLTLLNALNQTSQVATGAAGQQLNQAQLGWNQLAQLGGGLGSAANLFGAMGPFGTFGAFG